MKKKIFSIIRLVNIHKFKGKVLSLVLLSTTLGASSQTFSLQQCIDSALLYNKNLQISRNNIELGAERHREARAHLLPNVTLQSDYKYFADQPTQLMPQSAFGGPAGQFKEVQMGVPHNLGINLQLLLPLYNAQIYGAIKATEHASELNRLQYRKAEEQLLYEISGLYYNAQILNHQIVFLDSNLVNTARLLRNLELLHSQMMVKKSDVERVSLQKEELSTQCETVEASLEQVMDGLKFLMGIPQTQHILIDAEIQYKPIKDLPGSVPADVQLAIAQKNLLSTEWQTLKKSRLPTVALMGSYGQSGMGYDKKPYEFLHFYPVSFAGLQVSVPLFNGTVTQRKINQKKLEIQNNQLQIDLVTEQNSILAANAIRQRSIKQQTIEDTRRQIELAFSIYEKMVLQQKEGTASLTDVLLADNALREGQQRHLSAIIDYLKADLELKRINGNISQKN